MLLGNAGAITASSRKIEYDSPSVDRPNRLTIQWPPRAPRPHFTTALATRNATTMSRMVAVGETGVGVLGLSSPVSTAAAMANTDAVRIGSAPTTTEKIARGEDREQPPGLHGQLVGRRAPPQTPRRSTIVAALRHEGPAAGGRHHRDGACPVIATGSSTSAICWSVRIFFSRTSSMMPRPVFIASAASSVERS